jgi:hypothetical protein
MNDGFEVGQRVVVVECDCREAGPIEGSVRADDALTEAIGEEVEQRGAGALQLVHDRIRVDEDGAACGETPAYGGLS